jgi:hypothetical protein
MRILTTSAALSAALLLSLAGTSPSFAKGHNNGFGAGAAGPATAGKVDNDQSNNVGSTFGGGGSATSYGIRDQVEEAQSGGRGNSGNAQTRDGDPSNGTHPSERN